MRSRARSRRRRPSRGIVVYSWIQKNLCPEGALVGSVTRWPLRKKITRVATPVLTLKTTTSSTPSPRTPGAVFTPVRGGRVGMSTSGVWFFFILGVHLLALLLGGLYGGENCAPKAAVFSPRLTRARVSLSCESALPCSGRRCVCANVSRVSDGARCYIPALPEAWGNSNSN